MQTQNLNMHGLGINNLAPGVQPTDAVIVSQLPKPAAPTTPPLQHYTIVFSNDGTPTVGAAAPPFMVQVDRTGIPTQVWVACIGAPTGSPATFNVQRNGVNILSTPLSLPVGSLVATSSQFSIPVPQFGAADIIVPYVIAANNVSQVSIGIVIQRTMQGVSANS